MPAATVHATLHDHDRLVELAALDLGARRFGAELDELAVAAAAAARTPMGLVTVMLDDAQLFAGAHGLPDAFAAAGGTVAEWSFCRHTVHVREPLVIEDALTDPRVNDSPIVAGGAVRAYLGVPLITSRGHAVGTVCALDVEARPFTAQQLVELERLGRRATALLEERRAGRRARHLRAV